MRLSDGHRLHACPVRAQEGSGDVGCFSEPEGLPVGIPFRITDAYMVTVLRIRKPSQKSLA